MARHTSRHAARRTWLGGFAVCLIVAFSGYLLVTNVRVNRTATVTSDTADLVEQRVEHVDQLQKDITDLSAQINTLKDFANNSGSSEQPSGTSDPKPSDTEDAGSGTILPAVHGPRHHRDPERLPVVGEHGGQLGLGREHQRLRRASGGCGGCCQRPVGGRRGVDDDHGPARVVQFRSDLPRECASITGQEILAAVHRVGDPHRCHDSGFGRLERGQVV